MMRGRNARRWSSEPRSRSNPPASTTVSMKGSTTSRRPHSSMIIIVSTALPPRPPYSSTKGAARKPNSANCFQVSREWPSGLATIRLRVALSYSAAIYLPIVSRSSTCSSLNEKSTFCPLKASPVVVIPAKAGIQRRQSRSGSSWAPAFAGMTISCEHRFHFWSVCYRSSTALAIMLRWISLEPP